MTPPATVLADPVPIAAIAEAIQTVWEFKKNSYSYFLPAIIFPIVFYFGQKLTPDFRTVTIQPGIKLL